MSAQRKQQEAAMNGIRLKKLAMMRGAAKWMASALAFACGALMLIALPQLQTNVKAAGGPPLKLVIFDGPSVDHDAVWMAIAKGYYKDEGLDVSTRIFPSGTAAFQSFKAGEGDIMMGGELAALSHWRNSVPDYRVIMDLERDSEAYIAVVRNEIKNPEDLKGKTIGVLKGASGQWFLSEYLAKHNIPESAVTIKNLTNPVLPVALCQGDIQALFSWQPRGTRAMAICGKDIHYLSTAKGYMRGYNLAGARASWLKTPEGREAAMRFVRATAKGSKVAASDFEAVYQYAKQKFGMSEEDVKEQYKYLVRPLAFDDGFFSDFCSLSKWAQDAGIFKGKSDLSGFVWTDGIKAVDPKLVVPTPPPC
jgi:ABC-type nitrate/sulfonate/bicarbonate transport system substrate-binding protein